MSQQEYADARREQLLSAADMIADVRDSFPGRNEKSRCECCGVVKYDNFDEHLLCKELNAVIAKLQKLAERLERPLVADRPADRQEGGAA